ncbi:DUF3311 domain-containing protein [Sphingosinicellaceae bacterium]|nr:DUF3311 domain-containing protein [Sphingosinicellaceae bacterium]
MASDRPRQRRWHLALLVLPFVWQVALAPWANGIEARPFALPFAMAWQMGGVVFASLVITIVYLIDRRREARNGTP